MTDNAASPLNYVDAAAAVNDLVTRHPLPMAMLDTELRILGLSRNFASYLPPDHDLAPGDSVEVLIDTLGQIAGGAIFTKSSIAVASDADHSNEIGQAIRNGQWRLCQVLTCDGRVVSVFNYPLASGNTQLVLLEPSRMNDLTDLGEVLEVAADAFAIFNDEQILIRCNAPFASILTTDPNAAPPLGSTATEIVRDVVRNGIIKIPPGTAPDAMIEFIVASLLTESGSTFELEGMLGRIFFAATKPRVSGGHILTLRDVTEARDTQRRTLRTLSDAIEALAQGFALFDEQRRLVFCNPRYQKLLFDDSLPEPKPGMHNTELARLSLASGRFILPEGLTDEKAVERLDKWMIAERKGFELRLTDGTILDCGYSRTAIGGYLVTLHDITDRRASEQRALATLQDAAGTLEEGFALWDRDFRFLLCNDRYCELAFADSAFRPSPGQHGLEIALEMAKSASGTISLDATAEQFARELHDQISDLAKKIELRLDNGKIIEISGHKTAQKGYLITVLDVTERHRAAEEIERQTNIANQNEKLSALGELLAGVAHELNNPLSIVVGYSQLLESELKEERQLVRVRRVTQAAERSARIVKTFLAMARQRPTKMEPVDIADVIETSVDVAAYGLRISGGRLTVNCAPDLPLVSADKDQLVQVLSNLIINAEHAMKGMGNEAHLSINARASGRQVEIVIIDNGSGMDDETRARIFEPFFTTKDVGSGTGFGLAFCHRIVTSHGGQLEVRTAPGKGSEFIISLPLCAPKGDDGDASAIRTTRQLRALVVDDEADVADLVAEILAARGHAVTCAYGPVEALDKVRSGSFDIVISDMKMPEMTGDQLLREIVSIQPTLVGRVGFITGDSLSAKVRDFLEDSSQHYIEKPVVIEELLDLVDRIRPRGPWKAW